jgi:hypothetical protein
VIAVLLLTLFLFSFEAVGTMARGYARSDAYPIKTDSS